MYMDSLPKKVVCTVGLPFSGKSSFVKKLSHDGWAVISRDEVLEHIVKSPEFEAAVDATCRDEGASTPEARFAIKNRLAIAWLGEAVRSAVRESKSNRIVFDGTNLQKKMRAEVLQLRSEGVRVEAAVFNVPADKIVERAQRAWEAGERDGSFNRGAFGNLERMARMAEDITPDEAFDHIEIIPYAENKERRKEPQFYKLK